MQHGLYSRLRYGSIGIVSLYFNSRLHVAGRTPAPCNPHNTVVKSRIHVSSMQV